MPREFHNFLDDTVFKTVIFKSDISDHFPICFIIPASMKQKMLSYLKENLTLNKWSCLNRNCMKPVGRH